MVRKTLFKIIAIGINSIAVEERDCSTLNTRTGGDLWQTSRMRGWVDGKLQEATSRVGGLLLN